MSTHSFHHRISKSREVSIVHKPLSLSWWVLLYFYTPTRSSSIQLTRRVRCGGSSRITSLNRGQSTAGPNLGFSDSFRAWGRGGVRLLFEMPLERWKVLMGMGVGMERCDARDPLDRVSRLVVGWCDRLTFRRRWTFDVLYFVLGTLYLVLQY